jgi:hypothetical protein
MGVGQLLYRAAESHGKAYAVAIMDLCSRRILGITVSYTMQTSTHIELV